MFLKPWPALVWVWLNHILNNATQYDKNIVSWPNPKQWMMIHSRSLTKVMLLTWWRHQMETISALLAIYSENSPATGEFSTQRPVTRGFDVCFDLHLNKRLSKQWWGWWLRRHRAHHDVFVMKVTVSVALVIIFFSKLVRQIKDSGNGICLPLKR